MEFNQPNPSFPSNSSTNRPKNTKRASCLGFIFRSKNINKEKDFKSAQIPKVEQDHAREKREKNFQPEQIILVNLEQKSSFENRRKSSYHLQITNTEHFHLLDTMTWDVYGRICQYLTVKDLARLSQGNKSLSKMTKKDFYWEYQYKRDWSNILGSANGHTFKEKCALAFKEAHPPTIVVVDDNAFNLIVAEHLLKEFGFITETAIGGQKAINILQESHKKSKNIKAIFMELFMPVMDGFETTQELIKLMDLNKIKKVPIIAWTAESTENYLKRCFHVGMVDYLTKPTFQEDMRKILSTWRITGKPEVVHS